MEQIDQVLKRSVERFGLKNIYVVSELLDKWPEIVGAQLAEKTTPLAIKEKVLLIRTVNPGWSHQLTLLKPLILGRLKNAEYTVDDLRFICKEESKQEPEIKPKTFYRTSNNDPKSTRKKPKLRDAINSYLEAQEHTTKNGPNT